MRKSNSERGIALIVVLFALMVLTAVGLGMMYMTSTETGISSNFRSEQQAYYASKAGLEEGRDRLRYNTTNFITFTNGWALPNTSPGANTGSVVYILNPSGPSDTVAPWTYGSAYFDDELCHENFSGLGMGSTSATVPCGNTMPSGSAWYTTVTSTDPNTGTSTATPYKWVRITLKQDKSSGVYCSDGPSCTAAAQQVCSTMNGTSPYNPPYYETPLPSGFSVCEADNMRSVFVLTSLSRLPNGSRKMTQYEVANMVIPPLPGAITFDGSGPNFSPPSSNALTINGADAHTCTSWAAPTMPAIAGYDASSASTLTADIPSNRYGNYTGSGGSPSVVNQNSALGILSTVGGLQQLVSNVSYAADQTFGTNPTISNLGTSSAPKITVVNGDFNWSGSTSGSGVLLVTGTLTITGTPSFNGVVLVVGQGKLVYKGSGSGVINGGLFVANLYDSSGNPLPASSNPGAPTLSWSGGGNLTLNYDSCWTNNMSNRTVLRVLASHEELY